MIHPWRQREIRTLRRKYDDVLLALCFYTFEG